MNHFSRELRGIGDEGKGICHLEEVANGGHHVRGCHKNKNDMTLRKDGAGFRMNRNEPP